jgi:hypothetical protein
LRDRIPEIDETDNTSSDDENIKKIFVPAPTPA